MSDRLTGTAANRKGPNRWHLLSLFALLAALVPAVEAGYMAAKAQLAQTLIAHSWQQTGNKPWPWADTQPVARLRIAALNLDTYVLSGATGESMAFAPGMTSGSSNPGARGVTMIAAHRDTHFRSLGNIQTGHNIAIQDQQKDWHHYRVTDVNIMNSNRQSIDITHDASRLFLVTCYPFASVRPGGPMRFVVEAELIGDET